MEEPTDDRVWIPWVEPATSCAWPRRPTLTSFTHRWKDKRRPRPSLRERRLRAGKRVVADSELTLMLAFLREGPRLQVPTWSGE